jgi:hypothetical protein
MIDLTPQQIKDNAPEGATHYYNGLYYKNNEGSVFIWDTNHWRELWLGIDDMTYLDPLL